LQGPRPALAAPVATARAARSGPRPGRCSGRRPAAPAGPRRARQ